MTSGNMTPAGRHETSPELRREALNAAVDAFALALAEAGVRLGFVERLELLRLALLEAIGESGPPQRS